MFLALFSVLLALPAPLIALLLIIFTLRRSSRARASRTLRNSVVYPILALVVYVPLAWAFAPQMLDALAYLTIVGMTFTLSSFWSNVLEQSRKLT